MTPAHLSAIRAALNNDTLDDEGCRSVFEAVLLSVREPTEGMVYAVDMTNFEANDRMHFDEAWTVAIDALLAE